MCGIAGFCNASDNWQENITRMNLCMSHRGPDAEGIWANEAATVVLGHRRLSILDLSLNGSQPMISADGRFVMVLNGEIYNHGKIAEKLQREGKVSSFRGHSDTEILLEAIDAYGFESAIKLTKGMFAVAAYDKLEKKMFLARDRGGEKPLYYGFIGKMFIFASEIAPIRAHEKFIPELDTDALSLYFRYGYIPAPYTIYTNIKKLEAGFILELDFPYTSVRQYRYWDIMDVVRQGRNHPFNGSLNEAADELERLLKESIKEQMVADVPVGAFLSGGIDSTTVVALMQSVSSNKVKTFSIGFHEQEYNEAKDARETAAYIGTEHTELYLSDAEAMEIIPLLPQMYGEPFADVSQIPTYLVSKLARQQVTVSLSGDAGDELFGGYNHYERIRDIWNLIKYFPLPFRRTVSSLLSMKRFESTDYLCKIGHFLSADSPETMIELRGNLIAEADRLVKNQSGIPDCKYSLFPRDMTWISIENRLSLMDFLMYLPDDILVKVDRASMAVSLESRIPLLDKDIIEFAWTLPSAYKIKGKDRKRVLKNVLYRYVPESMMQRPKKGFSVPVAQWIRNGKMHDWSEELLDEKTIKSQGILDEANVRKLWKRFLDTGYGYYKIWPLLVFQQWMRENKL